MVGGGGSVSTQAGAVQTPETGSWLQSCPTTGWATWSHPAPGVRAEKGIVCALSSAPGNHPTLDGGLMVLWAPSLENFEPGAESLTPRSRLG